MISTTNRQQNGGDYRISASERGGQLTERTAQKVFERALVKQESQTGHLPFSAPQLCHAPAGKRHGRPVRPGTARAQ